MKSPPIESDYDLELERAVKEIKKNKAKIVCLQFPDGLKPLAVEVASELKIKTGAKCLIWLGSCFGACDVPQPERLEKLGIDMIIQWGHSEWPFKGHGLKVL